MFSFDLKILLTVASSLFSAYTSVEGSMLLVHLMAKKLIPAVRSYVYSKPKSLFTPLSFNLTFIIDELYGVARNQVYDAVKLRWRFNAMETKKGRNEYSRESSKHQFFELTFHQKHKDIVMDVFFPYMLARANAIKEEEKVVKLYSHHLCSYDDGNNSTWGFINLKHPATFETMAMDPELKKMIAEDLDRFVRSMEFYKKVGKAWKKPTCCMVLPALEIKLDRSHG
ncbi:hypothetical protein ACFX16_018727 [Malus domestica]